MTDGPILRIFEVKTKEGCAETLLNNFATTSAGVVAGHPGNQGYFFGECVQGAEDTVMFVSIWADLDAVKARFGDDWQVQQSVEAPSGTRRLILDGKGGILAVGTTGLHRFERPRQCSQASPNFP